jgi:hypothetical protein
VRGKEAGFRAVAEGASFAASPRMFNVEPTEYVRRSYETLVDACEAHAEAAVMLARRGVVFRIGVLVATGAAAGVAVVAATWRPSWFLFSALTAALAFVISAIYVAFDQHPRIHGHRACSARLWVVCEEYRALLAEMEQGLLEAPVLRDRRHALLAEAAAVFEHVAPADRHTLAIAKRALGARSGAPMVPPPAPADAAARDAA